MARKNMFDEIMEAVTFAEAGETERASAIAAEVFDTEASRKVGRILALSHAPGFSLAMVDRAIALADRLHYGLFAVSVPRGLLGSLRRGPDRDEWGTPEMFRTKAEERKIPFAHDRRSGDPERVVLELTRRIHRIAFLLIDPRQLPRARFSSIGIPIFAVTDE
jgi:hypothetical protein